MKIVIALLILLAPAFPVLAGLTAQQTQHCSAQIDSLLTAHWKSAGLPAGEPATDEVFLRRIYLDLAGRIPTSTEATEFLNSKAADKRLTLINDLLARESYVSHFSNYWADILRLKSTFINTANVVPAAYEKFIKESLRTNKPYDQFVREMLSATGYAWDNGAVGYYGRDPEMPLDNMAITSRIFLGTRIECAQCHDHPFDKWKQTEFYHLAAYTFGNHAINEAFSGAREAQKTREQTILDDFKKQKAEAKDGGHAAEARKKERLEALEYRKIVGIIKGCVGQLFSPIGIERNANSVLKLPVDFHQSDGKPGDAMKPLPIFGTAPDPTPGSDRSEIFARWVASPENSTFTKVIANRLWKKLFGVGLIEPLDELHDSTEAMVPEVEAYIEKLMISLKYDMRTFLAVIANTRAYQSAVAREEFAPGSRYRFQGPILRRMTAEQIWDSLVALANYEPDARDFKREERDARRIAVSQMACDAYLNFDGTKLVDMAYSRLQAEKELEAREKAVKEAMIVAKRNRDRTREIELRHQEGALDKERGETFVRDFIMPVLTNLAQLKGGSKALPIVDETYKMNPNPRVLQTETWKRLYVQGYGPMPKSQAQLDSESKREIERMTAFAIKLGLPEKERAGFAIYSEKLKTHWLRASELESPAPRGHFLRTMGQSDRDFVENSNPNASIPQALALMNGDLISQKGLLSAYSPLMQFIAGAKTQDAKTDATYLALLSRRPTAAERAAWTKAANGPLKSTEDLIYALLNTKQFIFIQ